MGAPTSARLTNYEAINIIKKLKKKKTECIWHIISQGEWANGTPTSFDKAKTRKSDLENWENADLNDLGILKKEK